MRLDIRESGAITIAAVREVYAKPWYWVLGITIFLVTLVFSIWLPNISFVVHTATSDVFTLSQKGGILLSSLGALKTNFTPLSRALTIAITLLLGVNISLFVYYMKKRMVLEKSAGMSLGGVVAGLLGVGCASCGSVILSSIFGIGATAGFIGVLPLKGQEFGILSILIITASIILVAKKIREPLVC